MAVILFVTYHDFTSNSAIQIHTFANQLVREGHTCVVAVPGNKDTVHTAIGGEVLYTPADFSDLKRLFSDGKGPDIIHGWTPREIVRKECILLQKKFGSKLVVHLEDNEEQILSDSLKIPIRELRLRSPEEISAMTPDHLSHLIYYRDFLERADAVTVIMDRLMEFVPDTGKCMVLWPGIDRLRFAPGSDGTVPGIDSGTLVLCYTGNVHASNYREVRSLYLAVALLNRIGIPTKLIRTGVDHVPFLGDDPSWAHDHSIELGFVPYETIPALNARADILVQPGRADEFNAYRLPSKLPEFFCMGKPVILPSVNLGRFVTDGKEAILLQSGTAIEIVGKICMIRDDPRLARRLSLEAEAFAVRSFDVVENTKKLERLYERLLAGGRV